MSKCLFFLEAILKKQISKIALGAIALGLTACVPNADQLRKAVESDPGIVFAAIEKDPLKFIEVVNKAAREAQMKQQEKEQNEEKEKRDAEFKTPLAPTVDESRAMMGAKSGKITIVEYSDFECPYCQKGFNTVKEVLKEFPNDVRILFKHLPLDFHPLAMPAAKFYEALALQSPDMAIKFHDNLFQNREKFVSEDRAKKVDLGMAYMKKVAKELGANMKKLEADLASDSIMKNINADMEEARKFEFNGTPGFIINGVSLRGAYPASEFKAIIDRHLGK